MKAKFGIILVLVGLGLMVHFSLHQSPQSPLREGVDGRNAAITTASRGSSSLPPGRRDAPKSDLQGSGDNEVRDTAPQNPELINDPEWREVWISYKSRYLSASNMGQQLPTAPDPEEFFQKRKLEGAERALATQAGTVEIPDGPWSTDIGN